MKVGISLSKVMENKCITSMFFEGNMVDVDLVYAIALLSKRNYVDNCRM